jgi:hypothetical protein
MTLKEAAAIPTTGKIMKGHKPSPRPAPNELLIKRVSDSITGRYMAARCAICGEPVHFADSRRWRHGDKLGIERVAR